MPQIRSTDAQPRYQGLSLLLLLYLSLFFMNFFDTFTTPSSVMLIRCATSVYSCSLVKKRVLILFFWCVLEPVLGFKPFLFDSLFIYFCTSFHLIASTLICLSPAEGSHACSPNTTLFPEKQAEAQGSGIYIWRRYDRKGSKTATNESEKDGKGSTQE